MSKERNLMIVAHAFPPSGGAGVRRVLKVVKYLMREGWSITVLAPKRDEFFAYPYDPSLLDQVPNTVGVVESFTPEGLLMRPSGSTNSGETTKAAMTHRPIYRSWYRRVYKGLGSWIAVPESSITWLPFAVSTGRRMIRENRIDVILATGPPFSSLLVGAVLNKMSSVPLVVEFRDAWVAEPVRNRGLGKRRLQIERTQEQWTISRADRVISVTDGVTSDFRSRYADIEESDKFLTIHNGFDRDDFPMSGDTQPRVSTNEKFLIVHTGTLGGVRTPWAFLASVNQLLTRRPSLRSRLQIEFIGRCNPFVDGATLQEYVQRLDLQDVVRITGFVSRNESIDAQYNADLLLLIIGQVPPSGSDVYGLSAKVYDYTLADRPVLAIADDGPTASYVRESGIGEVVSHHDRQSIVEAIERSLAGTLYHSPRQEFIRQYDYSMLIRNLDGVLRSV